MKTIYLTANEEYFYFQRSTCKYFPDFMNTPAIPANENNWRTT